MADNKIYLQKTNKSNPANPLYGDLIYNKDGTLKTVNENNVPITLVKKSELNTEVQAIENKLAKKADLDESGFIPASQLPSYVDDVLEYSNKNNFPKPGEENKVYIDTSTNITYRWSGSDYVVIGSDLALGETAATAYAGNKGKQNADNIAAILDGTKPVGKVANPLTIINKNAQVEYNGSEEQTIDLSSVSGDQIAISKTKPTSKNVQVWYEPVEEGEYPPGDLATKEYVQEEVNKLKEGTTVVGDSAKLGGQLPDYYAPISLCNEIEKRLSFLEYMTMNNDYYAPIATDDKDITLIVDNDGSAILANYKL